MDLHDLVLTLRKRWHYVAVALCVCVGVALLMSARATKLYRADATLYVAGQAGDVASIVQTNQLSQALVQSYASLVTKKPIAEAAAQELGLPAGTGDTIRSEVSAAVVPATTLITVSVTDPSPVVAARYANAIGRVFATRVPALEQGAGGVGTPVLGAPIKVTLFEEATPPSKAVSPNTRLAFALSVLLGLLVGGSGALIRQSQDKSIRSAADVRSLARTTVLGAVVFDPESGKQPLVVQTDPKSGRAEAIRQIRTNIQFVNIDDHLRSFTVTSALPSEGKSTLSCNLAIALSQAGHRVILVEGDLRKPSLREYMGIEGAVGLTSVLIGQASLVDVLQPWGVGGLRILPSGPTPPNPSELLGSHVMASLVKELEGMADMVVFDAPPLLPVTDGAVLAALTGGALLVVRHGKTHRDQLEGARELLDHVGAKVLGAVLTMVPPKGQEGYDGAYGYGYAQRGPAEGMSLDAATSALQRAGAKVATRTGAAEENERADRQEVPATADADDTSSSPQAPTPASVLEDPRDHPGSQS